MALSAAMPNKKPNRHVAIHHDFASYLLGFALLSANLRFDADVWSASGKFSQPSFLISWPPNSLRIDASSLSAKESLSRER